MVIDEHMFKRFTAACVGAKSVGASGRLQHTFTRHGLDFNQTAETAADALVQLRFHPCDWVWKHLTVLLSHCANKPQQTYLAGIVIKCTVCMSACLFHPLGKHSYMQATNNG